MRTFNVGFVLSVLLSLAACDGGYEQPLGNDFALHRSSDSIVLIFRQDGAGFPRHPSFAEPEHDIVLGARVRQYALLDEVLVGNISDRPESPYAYLATPGWFVVDRTNGAVSSGLSESEWKRKLNDYGIDPSRIELFRAR